MKRLLYVAFWLILLSHKVLAQEFTVNAPEYQTTICSGDQSLEAAITFNSSVTNPILNIELDEGIYYVSGSISAIQNGSSLNVTETSVTDLSNVILTLSGDYVSGDKIDITYAINASCSSVDETILADDNIQFAPKTVSINGQDLPLQVLIPHIIVDQPLETSEDHQKQGYFTQDIYNEIPIRILPGAGKLSSFTFKISLDRTNVEYKGLYLSNSSGTQQTALLTLASGQINDDGTSYYLTLDKTLLNQIGLGDNLDPGESILIKEWVKLKNCNSDFSRIDYEALWGCEDISSNTIELCNEGLDLVNSQNFLTINPPFYPASLSVNYEHEIRTSYCHDNQGVLWVTLTNTRNKKWEIVKDIAFRISGTSVIKQVAIDYNADEIISQDEIVNPENDDNTRYTFSPSNEIPSIPELVSYNDDSKNDLLPEGELKIKIVYELIADDKECLFDFPSIVFGVSHKNICGEGYWQDKNIGDGYNFINNTNVSGPVDILQNQPTTFTFTPSVSHWNEGLSVVCTDKKYDVELTLPIGYKIVNEDGNATYKGNSIVATQTGNKVLIKGGGINGTYSIDLITSCDEINPRIGALDELKWELFYYCDSYTTGDGASCPNKNSLICATYNTYSHFSCGNAGNGCVLATTGFDFDRLTYGKSLLGVNGNQHQLNINDYNNLPFASNNASFDTTSVLICDKLVVELFGKLEGNNCSEFNGENIRGRIFLKLPYKNRNATVDDYFEIIRVEAELENQHVDAVIINKDIEDDGTLFFDLALPENTIVMEGKVNFYLTLKSRPSTNLWTAYLEEPIFRGYHYSSDNVFSESYGTIINLFSFQTNYGFTRTSEKINASNEFCKNQYSLSMQTHIYGIDDFPNAFKNEFRNLNEISNITIQIPEDYSLNENFTPSISGIEIPFSNFSNTSKTLSINAKDSYFQSKWIVYDATHGNGFTTATPLNFVVKPLCPIESSSLRITGEVSFEKNSINCLNDYIISNTRRSGSEAILRYDLAGGEQFAINKDVTWSIKLYNDASHDFYFVRDASNTWIAIEPVLDNEAVINFTNVEFYNSYSDSFSDVEWFEYTHDNESKGRAIFINVGNIRAVNGPSFRELRITANYQNCQEDQVDHFKVVAGWGCSYPISEEIANTRSFDAENFEMCLGEPIIGGLTLEHKIAKSEVASQVLSSTAPFGTCIPIRLQSVYSSTGVATVYDYEPSWSYSGIGTSSNPLSIRNITAQYGNTTVQIPNTELIAINENAIKLSNLGQYIPELAANGFKGGSSAKQIILTYDVYLECNFDPADPILTGAQGLTNCNSTLDVVDQSLFIPVDGFDPLDNIDVELDVVDNEPGKLLLTVANRADVSLYTYNPGTDRYAFFILPQSTSLSNAQIVSGQNVSNRVQKLWTRYGTVWQWKLPDLNSGEQLDIELTVNSSISGQNILFKAAAVMFLEKECVDITCDQFLAEIDFDVIETCLGDCSCLSDLSKEVGLPLEKGFGVVTNWASTVQGLPEPLDKVLTIFDLRTPSYSLEQEWKANQEGYSYRHPDWTIWNLGTIFGLTLDDDANPNIYVTASNVFDETFSAGNNVIGTEDSYFPGATEEEKWRNRGAIYKINSLTGEIANNQKPFALLPVYSGHSLGNICYNPDDEVFYASNFDDGIIYQITKSGQVSQLYDFGEQFNPNFYTDGGNYYSQGAPYGELIWAVQYFQGRLYFSVWEEKDTGSDVGGSSIYSIDILETGSPGGDLRKILEAPIFKERNSHYGFTQFYMPVSDISFSRAGKMAIAQRTMAAPNWSLAHNSSTFEYEQCFGSWINTGTQFKFGSFYSGYNASGGVAYMPNGNVLASGDLLEAYVNNETAQSELVYGLHYIDLINNKSYDIDQNGIYTKIFNSDGSFTERATQYMDKSHTADIEIFTCPGDPIEIPKLDIIVSDLCVKKPTYFSYEYDGDPSIINNASFAWEFGENNAVSSLEDPSYSYKTEGTKQVTLDVDFNIPGKNCVLSSEIEIDLESCTPPPPSCEECIESFAPIPGEEYVLSVWVKESKWEGKTTFNSPSVTIYFDGSPVVYESIKAEGAVIDGWQRIEYAFLIPQEATHIRFKLNNESLNPSTEVFFDDIRIHPFNSNMKSFVYDPVSLRLWAELDENNYATFYEYDEEGALVRVKKETERGVKTIQESRNNTQKNNP